MKQVLNDKSAEFMGRALKLTSYNYDDAQDLFQETVLKCLQMGDRYEHLHPSQKKQVVYTTMYNIFLDGIRKKNKATIICDYSEFSGNCDQQEAYDNKKVFELIRSQEDDIYVRSFLLFHMGYSCKEVSVITDKHLNTARSNIRNGRLKLKGDIKMMDIMKLPKPTRKAVLKSLSDKVNELFVFYEKAS